MSKNRRGKSVRTKSPERIVAKWAYVSLREKNSGQTCGCHFLIWTLRGLGTVNLTHQATLHELLLTSSCQCHLSSTHAPLPSLSISSMSTNGLEEPTLFRHCTILPGIAPTYVRLCAGEQGIARIVRALCVCACVCMCVYVCVCVCISND